MELKAPVSETTAFHSVPSSVGTNYGEQKEAGLTRLRESQDMKVRKSTSTKGKGIILK